MRLIGLTGLKRSGKDTFARHLVDHHGYVSFALADPLRAMALALDPIVGTEEYYEGTACDCCTGSYFEQEMRLRDLVDRIGWEAAKDHEDFGPEVRRTLQRLGTEAVRDTLGPDVWVTLAARKLDDLIAAGHERIVITDVRFPNEADLVTARVGSLVRLIRAGHGAAADSHASENALTDRAATVEVRASSLAELRAAADRIA